MKPKYLLVLPILAIAAALYVLLVQDSKPAPEVVFQTLDGRTVQTSQLRGKVVLVNFWATTCPSCVKEMPQMAATHTQFANKGYETIAVAMSYDPPEQVQAFAQQKQLPFTIAFDPQGKIAESFGGVRLTPTSFLIDKEGRIVQQYLGEPDFAKLRRTIDSLLSQSS